MADIPQIPDWLARKIALFIDHARSGQVTLSFTDRRVQSYDLQLSGRVGHNGTNGVTETEIAKT